MGKYDVDRGIVASLSGQEHVLHGPHRFEWVFGHRGRVPECSALAAWSGGVHENSCGAVVEEVEYGVQDRVTEIGAVCVGVEPYAIEFEAVKAVLFRC